MTQLSQNTVPALGRERNETMRKDNRNAFDSIVYERIRDLRMSERERQIAIGALRKAELIVDGILWVQKKLESLGALFLKPGLKQR